MISCPYPPLTSTKEQPLHPDGVYTEDKIWACTTPERPRDNRTAYDWRCEGCVFMAESHVTIQGDVEMMWTPNKGVTPEKKPLSWMVARSRWWWE